MASRVGLSSTRKSRKKPRSYRCEILLVVVNILLFGYGIVSFNYVRMVQERSSINTAAGDTTTSQEQQQEPLKASQECTAEQLATVKKQLPPTNSCFEQPWRNECSFTVATKCPDSKNWLQEHYRQVKSRDLFVGLDIGCTNNGYDALEMLRMGTGLEAADKAPWQRALAGNVIEGMPCLTDSQPDIDVDDYAVKRKGQVYCIEPVEASAKAFQEALTNSGLDKIGFHMDHAVLGHSGDDAQVLDTYVQQHLPKHTPRIHMITMNMEGSDYSVMLGGKRTLERTEYIAFGYTWKGAWKDQSLKRAVQYLDSMHFTCYWTGIRRLWRITNCWLDHYSRHNWSNIGCVNRLLVPEFAHRMEQVFEDTLEGKM